MRKSLYLKRILGFSVLFAALATTVMVIRYFAVNVRKDKLPISNSQSTEISMKTIYFTESHENKKKWELFAQSGTHDKAKEVTSLEDVRFIVARDGDIGPVTITAQHGNYSHKSKTVQLEGNVLAKTKNGMVFQTSQLDYNSAKRVFITKEKVSLNDASLTVEGVGMELSVDSQKAIVKSQVEATIRPVRRMK